MSEQENQQGERGERHEGPRPEPPRIYVASLSDYNAGRLHGAWIDAAQTAEALQAAISEMLARSREPMAEEWAIHDYEGFGHARLAEYESLKAVSALATGIEAHGPAFAGWASQCEGLDPAELDQFDEAYRGSWPDVEAYAEDFLDDLGAAEELEAVPDWLQPYVALDISGFARDLELGGEISVVDHEGGVWIFDRTV